MPIKPAKKKKVGQYSKGAVGNFYSQAAWIKLRNYRLLIEPLCRMCYEDDPIKATYPTKKVVDHIKPISEGGNALDFNNTQTLCEHHHAIKTGTETAKRNR